MKQLGHYLYCGRAESVPLEQTQRNMSYLLRSELEGRVCDTCNNRRLGVLDEQLARCGPEGFFRKWYGIEGRAHHERVNPFYREGAGGRRQELGAWDPVWGVEVNLEVENGQARQLRELMFIEPQGHCGRTVRLDGHRDFWVDDAIHQIDPEGAIGCQTQHLR
jgi:hypothetical protein